MGARGQSCFCGPQEASQELRLQPAPAQSWEMAFFFFFFPFLCIAAGTVYNRKKKKENDQASRLENKET